jgi:hypothetical protein
LHCPHLLRSWPAGVMPRRGSLQQRSRGGGSQENPMPVRTCAPAASARSGHATARESPRSAGHRMHSRSPGLRPRHHAARPEERRALFRAAAGSVHLFCLASCPSPWNQHCPVNPGAPSPFHLGPHGWLRCERRHGKSPAILFDHDFDECANKSQLHLKSGASILRRGALPRCPGVTR